MEENNNRNMYIRLGKEIKRLRKQKGLTQSELASQVGFNTNSAISHLEKGDNDITRNKLVLIAKALDVTPAYLIGVMQGTDESAQQPCSLILSSDEQELVLLYRNMNANSKEYLLTTARAVGGDDNNKKGQKSEQA